MLKTKQEIYLWLNKMDIENYTINQDLSVNVDGHVNLANKNLNELPVQFNKVIGNFNISHNHLTNLKGCPKEIEGSIYISNNNINKLDLEELPLYLKGFLLSTITSYNLYKDKILAMEDLYIDNSSLIISLSDIKKALLKNKLDSCILEKEKKKFNKI